MDKKKESPFGDSSLHQDTIPWVDRFHLLAVQRVVRFEHKVKVILCQASQRKYPNNRVV